MSRTNADAPTIVTRLVEACEDEADFELRWHYLDQLIQAGSPAVPHLLPLLASESVDIRLLALHALGRIGDRSAAPIVEPLIENDPHLDVQGAAAETLARLRARGATARLVRALRTADEGKRTDAILALARLRSREAVPELLELAARSDVLGKFGFSQFVRAAVVYIERGLNGLRIILADQDEDLNLRRGAASVADLDGSPEAILILLDCLHDDDEQLVCYAIGSLVQLVRDALPHVTPIATRMVDALTVTLLSGSSGRNRMGAAALLGTLADPRALPSLQKAAADDPHEPTRRWAAKALQKCRRTSQRN